MEVEELQGDEVDLEGLNLGGGAGPKRKGNILPIWGNDKTMNLNSMILTNIQQSPYYKVNLAEFKTYHEIVDQIYYKVDHLEPWEKNSRRTSGQIGMCGGVRGVGAGGIVSSAYCLLYKLFVIRLTRKQLTALLNHEDSPYLRGIGFMYIRYCQPPADLWEWFEPYLDDPEEIDPRAGGGDPYTVGQMVRHFLSRLDWYGTLFPRIPVPVQKTIDQKLNERRQIEMRNRFEPEARVGGKRRSGSPFGRERSPRRDLIPRRPSPAPERKRSPIPERRRSPIVERRKSPIVERKKSPIGERKRSRSPAGGRGRSPEHRRREKSQSTGQSGEVLQRAARRADDLAELIEREKQRQRRHGDESDSRKRGQDDRNRDWKRHRSESRGSKSSDSSGTVERKTKEERHRKRKEKKHLSKNSHHSAEDKESRNCKEKEGKDKHSSGSHSSGRDRV